MTLRLLAIVSLFAVGVLLGKAADEPIKVVNATEVRAPDLKKAIADQKGKVVLVDCWATWCAPCVKKFPHVVELHKKYAEKGLVCVSVSMDKFGLDDDEYDKSKIVKFLKEKGAAFPNFIVSEPKKDGAELEKILGDFTAIPYMVIYDRTGKRVWTSDMEKLDNEKLAARIEAELEKKP